MKTAYTKVTQTVSLLCRRLAVGRAAGWIEPLVLGSAAQIDNLRNGRLPVCATIGGPRP